MFAPRWLNNKSCVYSIRAGTLDVRNTGWFSQPPDAEQSSRPDGEQAVEEDLFPSPSRFLRHVLFAKRVALQMFAGSGEKLPTDATRQNDVVKVCF